MNRFAYEPRDQCLLRGNDLERFHSLNDVAQLGQDRSRVITRVSCIQETFGQLAMPCIDAFEFSRRVRSLLSQSDRSELSAGDSGVVVAPGEAADRLFVDFGEKRWHLLAHTVMREEEHAAERSGASLGTGRNLFV